MHAHWLCCAAALSLGGSVWAQSLDLRPAWYLQATHGEGRSAALVAGTTRPWSHADWRWGNGQLRGHWDLWAGAWSNRDLEGQRFTTAALGAGPSLRWRGAQGRSPWFAEVGTAVMLTQRRLYNNDRRMGTAFNFASHLAVGRNFGPQHAHALSLRVQHLSNAGLRHPNPGLNAVQLRYEHTY